MKKVCDFCAWNSLGRDSAVRRHRGSLLHLYFRDGAQRQICGRWRTWHRDLCTTRREMGRCRMASRQWSVFSRQGRMDQTWRGAACAKRDDTLDDSLNVLLAFWSLTRCSDVASITWKSR